MNLKLKNLFCYQWNEILVKRGANEIGTCAQELIVSSNNKDWVKNEDLSKFIEVSRETTFFM